MSEIRHSNAVIQYLLRLYHTLTHWRVRAWLFYRTLHPKYPVVYASICPESIRLSRVCISTGVD